MQALIAVGSNSDAETNFRRLFAQIKTLEDIRLLKTSCVYRTAPVATHTGMGAQPSYLNAALLVETAYSPAGLKNYLRNLEDELGRTRNRSDVVAIDLDLTMAVAPAQASNSPHTPLLAHPDLTRYAHVAVPCAEIAPDWVHPTHHRTLRSIAAGFAHIEMEIVKL